MGRTSSRSFAVVIWVGSRSETPRMFSSSSFIESRLNSSPNRSDPDTEVKVRSAVRAVNDTIQSNANEPSLAFYRIQVGNWAAAIPPFHRLLCQGTRSENVTNDDAETHGTRAAARTNEWPHFRRGIQCRCCASLGKQRRTFQREFDRTWMASVDLSFQNIATYLEKSVYISKQMNLLKQQQVQQQLLERKPGSTS